MMPKVSEQPVARSTTNFKLSQLSKYGPLMCFGDGTYHLSKAGHKVVWYSVQQCFRKGCREALRGHHSRPYTCTWWYEVGFIPSKIGFDSVEEIS